MKNKIKFLINNICFYIFNKTSNYKVLSDEQTINEIIESKKSISRFGDGEFKWILGINQVSFQEQNESMATRLKEILVHPSKDLLVCIPMGVISTEGYSRNTKFFWRNFVRLYGKKIKNILNEDYNYGNALFTRWYMEYNDKNQCLEKLKNIKKIWNERKVLIIEGEDTKFGVNNDLLDNCKSVKRIIGPSKNAFNCYDKLLEEAKKVDTDTLIIIALGPTATILSSDLCNLGYQALDIGHLDIEYEWFLKQAKTKAEIVGKSVNEVNYGRYSGNVQDDEYTKSIICKILNGDNYENK